MKRSLTMQDITWFLDMNEKDQLVLDPPYQRRSVWSAKDRRFFVDTILNNYPAPPVFLHKNLDDRGKATFHVVDGKQRLQTIIDFSQNKVRIPDDFGNVEFQRKRFEELDTTTKKIFWNYEIIVEMLPDVSDVVIRNIFDRINRNSRKLTRQEMRHAKYDGWFINFVMAETEKEEWKEFGVVTASRIKRMADAQFMSELCAIVLRKGISGFDQNDLDQIYADYDDLSESPELVEDDVTAEMERLKGIVSELIRVQPDIKDYLKIFGHFYTLWAYLQKNAIVYTEVRTMASRYLAFMKAVDSFPSDNNDARATADKTQEFPPPAVRDYALNLRGASTDFVPRKKRLEGLEAAIHGQEDPAHEDS